MGGTSLAAVLATAGAAPTNQNYGIALAEDLPDNTALFGAKLTFLTGGAAGRSVFVTNVEGSMLTTSGEMHAELFDGVSVGDDVHIDNRIFVAWCYLHRYLLELDQYTIEDPSTRRRRLAPEFGGIRAWTIDGRPLYPQIQIESPTGGGTGHTGRFVGKMIHVNASHDSMVWPTGVAAYERKVAQHQAERIDDVYRLWWVENAPHGAPEFLGPAVTPEKDPGVWRSRLVGYDGVTAQALRELVSWVEDDVPATSNTTFFFTDDGGLVLGRTAEERGGVQPVVWATANGGVRADVKVGDSVRFEGGATQPPGHGSLVWGYWDFEGTGTVDHREELDAESASVLATHAFTAPGTFFASFRVGAHRDGRKGHGPAAENLARVRVVVAP